MVHLPKLGPELTLIVKTQISRTAKHQYGLWRASQRPDNFALMSKGGQSSRGLLALRTGKNTHWTVLVMVMEGSESQGQSTFVL